MIKKQNTVMESMLLAFRHVFSFRYFMILIMLVFSVVDVIDYIRSTVSILNCEPALEECWPSHDDTLIQFIIGKSWDSGGVNDIPWTFAFLALLFIFLVYIVYCWYEVSLIMQKNNKYSRYKFGGFREIDEYILLFFLPPSYSCVKALLRNSIVDNPDFLTNSIFLLLLPIFTYSMALSEGFLRAEKPRKSIIEYIGLTRYWRMVLSLSLVNIAYMMSIDLINGSYLYINRLVVSLIYSHSPEIATRTTEFVYFFLWALMVGIFLGVAMMFIGYCFQEYEEHEDPINDTEKLNNVQQQWQNGEYEEALQTLAIAFENSRNTGKRHLMETILRLYDTLNDESKNDLAINQIIDEFIEEVALSYKGGFLSIKPLLENKLNNTKHPLKADVIKPLSEIALQLGENKLAVKLLSGFMKQNRHHHDMADNLFIFAQALANLKDYGQSYKALTYIVKNYPDYNNIASVKSLCLSVKSHLQNLQK